MTTTALRGRDYVLILLIVLAWAGNFLTSALAMRDRRRVIRMPAERPLIG